MTATTDTRSPLEAAGAPALAQLLDALPELLAEIEQAGETLPRLNELLGLLGLELPAVDKPTAAWWLGGISIRAVDRLREQGLLETELIGGAVRITLRSIFAYRAAVRSDWTPPQPASPEAAPAPEPSIEELFPLEAPTSNPLPEAA